jgi:hypothetical protein
VQYLRPIEYGLDGKQGYPSFSHRFLHGDISVELKRSCYNRASTFGGGRVTCPNMLEHAINHINFRVITCLMVKRGGKEVITVEIFKETYDVMKANAVADWQRKKRDGS